MNAAKKPARKPNNPKTLRCCRCGDAIKDGAFLAGEVLCLECVKSAVKGGSQ